MFGSGSVQLFTGVVKGGLSDLNGLAIGTFRGRPSNETFFEGSPSATSTEAWKPNVSNARLTVLFTNADRLICVNQILIFENNGMFFVVVDCLIMVFVDSSNTFDTL